VQQKVLNMTVNLDNRYRGIVDVGHGADPLVLQLISQFLID